MNEIEETGVLKEIEVMEEKMTLSEEEFNEIYDRVFDIQSDESGN